MVYVLFGIISGLVGVIISFALVFICYSRGIDILKNLWLIAIPVTLAVILNLVMLEIYYRRKKK